MKGWNPEDGEYDQTHLWVMVVVTVAICIWILI